MKKKRKSRKSKVRRVVQGVVSVVRFDDENIFLVSHKGIFFFFIREIKDTEARNL